MKRFLVVLLIVSIALMGVLPVLAADVDTVASIDPNGAGSEPIVKAKWEQVAPENDDPNLPGIQLIPNPSPEDTPGEPGYTEVCVYAVVTDPNGIGDIHDVYFKVFSDEFPYGGGTWKVQVHMVRVTDPAATAAARAYAVSTGQITQDQSDELATELTKHDAEMWKACWTYDTHQCDGLYPIEVTAVDGAGNKGKLYNEMCVLSTVVLSIDFDTVDYGELVPGAKKWVPGDDNFNLVLNADRPTVWNRGNNNASLKIRWAPMIGYEEGKRIVKFDAQLFSQIVNVVVAEGADWSAWRTLVGPLLPCTPQQIDFSILPDYGLPADCYSGLMELQMIEATS